ncbi:MULTISPECIES: hypothetical protein [unclassified Frondihabitans]|uniref:hypothetical protein n=1 Tax=unclassified Frondihabitans TaxID=2626248 RepID=UPI000F912AB8|nr:MULTISPECIES: hypothetical protein [unclassified Frondihabitans]RPE73729.1 hypothetical protein EDF37_3426 [Frondihabitans sp. PhB153]RPF02134.1 hypothetical protein EDF39_3455 [Frondihabitans sp. PhB161]
MSAGNARVVTWFVRHRRKGDTNAEATVVEVQAATPAEAIARVRPTLPEGHIMTSVAPY